MPVPADKKPRCIIEYVGQVDTSPGIQIGATKLAAPQTGFRITVIVWGQEGIATTSCRSTSSYPFETRGLYL
jgi:Tfp pilus assembly protein PilX